MPNFQTNPNMTKHGFEDTVIFLGVQVSVSTRTWDGSVFARRASWLKSMTPKCTIGSRRVLDAVDRKKVAGTGGQLWQLSNEQENAETLPVILYCNYTQIQKVYSVFPYIIYSSDPLIVSDCNAAVCPLNHKRISSHR